jgi:hypothetical protein
MPFTKNPKLNRPSGTRASTLALKCMHVFAILQRQAAWLLNSGSALQEVHTAALVKVTRHRLIICCYRHNWCSKQPTAHRKCMHALPSLFQHQAVPRTCISIGMLIQAKSFTYQQCLSKVLLEVHSQWLDNRCRYTVVVCELSGHNCRVI